MKDGNKHEIRCRRIAHLIKTNPEWLICGYMSIYPFGTSFTATHLSKKLTIPRATTWHTLYKMHGKGLVKYAGEKSNGGRVSTPKGVEVPYLFTCLGCIAYELKREGN